jgi:hypothetical protein
VEYTGPLPALCFLLISLLPYVDVNNAKHSGPWYPQSSDINLIIKVS